jgi:hypothetical protein
VSELRILLSISLFVLLNSYGTRSAGAGVLLGKIDRSSPSEQLQCSCRGVEFHPHDGANSDAATNPIDGGFSKCRVQTFFEYAGPLGNSRFGVRSSTRAEPPCRR